MNKSSNALGFIAYIITWFLLLLWFWVGLPQNGAMIYSIIAFYLVLPVFSFILSCTFRIKNTLAKWLLPVFFGFMAMLLSYLTFDLANMIAFHNLNFPNFEMALISAVPSLSGLFINRILVIFNKNK